MTTTSVQLTIVSAVAEPIMPLVALGSATRAGHRSFQAASNSRTGIIFTGYRRPRRVGRRRGGEVGFEC
jgi:hypothetical protein